MFTSLIVRPIFNLLVLIYGLLPGHNFGLSIIIFTIVVRLLMWPLVKKQLHSAKLMRDLQPELKRIKKETKGDRQKESAMVMELYKERGVNPFGSLGLVILQIPILFGLYAGIRQIVTDPHNMVTFAYPFIQHNLNWLKTIGADIGRFDHTLFGVVDLTRGALGKGTGIYWPAMLLVVASAVAQYFQIKMLSPTAQDSRKLRDILRDAGKGSQTDQSEVNAAVGRSTQYLMPVMIFFLTVNIASALSLYWVVSGIVAIIQQSRVLKQDETEMEGNPVGGLKVTRSSDERARTAIEAEIISNPSSKTEPATSKSTTKTHTKTQAVVANQPTSKKSKKKHRRR